MQGLFSVTNLKLFGLSLVLLVVGYVFLAQGPVDNPLSMSVAPLVLVGVYCVLIPAALLVRGKSKSTDEQRPKKGV